MRKANSADKQSLIHLWQECFCDEKAEILSFFDAYFDSADTFVYELDGKIIAAAYCLPCQVLDAQSKCSARYLYALQTAKQFRGRGIMSSLMQYVRDSLNAQEIDIMYLMPACAKLTDFYARRGFSALRGRLEFSVECQLADKSACCEALCPADAARLRNKLLRGKNAVCFDEKSLEYIASFYAAEWLQFDNAIALVSRKSGDKLTVCELIAQEPCQVLESVFALYGINRATVRVPFWLEDKLTALDGNGFTVRLKAQPEPFMFDFSGRELAQIYTNFELS